MNGDEKASKAAAAKAKSKATRQPTASTAAQGRRKYKASYPGFGERTGEYDSPDDARKDFAKNAFAVEDENKPTEDRRPFGFHWSNVIVERAQ